MGYISAFYGPETIPWDSRDTISDPHRVQDPTWSFKGPYRDPKMDLMIFEKISGFVHLLYIIHPATPLDILEIFCWSLWNSTRALGTLLDCHGPSWTPKRTLKWTLRGKFWGTLGKIGLPRAPSWSKLINFLRKTSRQHKNLNLQPGLRSFGHSVPEI